MQAILSLYTLFFGFVVVMLEGRGSMYPSNWKKMIRSQAKFLTLLNGRGALYAFLGTLLMAQWPSFGSFLLGVYMVRCHHLCKAPSSGRRLMCFVFAFLF